MLLQSYEEHIKQISNLLVIFAGIAFKLEKVDPIFSSFNPCAPPLPLVATDDGKTVLMTKIDSIALFGF